MPEGERVTLRFNAMAEDESTYHTPYDRDSPVAALQQGLGIVELLASRSRGLTAEQIGQALGCSAEQIAELVNVLGQRGLISKLETTEVYSLTPRLFALSLGHPPTRRLLDEALPQMHALSHQTGQCCHLSQRYGTSVVVIAQVESPRPMGYSVRLGERHPVVETAAGLVLLAFEPPEEAENWLETAAGRGLDEAVRKIVTRTLVAIRKHGHLRKPNGQAMGIMDLSCPVVGSDRLAVASLTLPFVLEERPGHEGMGEADALSKLADAAGRITQALGGAALDVSSGASD